MTHPHPYSQIHGFPRLTGDGMVGRLGKPYFPDPALIAAANVSLRCRIPLLLTGEPGCGKTDFAFAAAHELAARAADDPRDRKLLECYVQSGFQARDLLYSYDALRRFADAHHGEDAERRRARRPGHYVTLQPLGRALLCPYQRVVLIDEIDKAPRDFPNDLLRVVEQRSFDILELAADVSPSADERTPESCGHELAATMCGPEPEDPDAPHLIVITSNVERQLPEPFLRRCAFFHISFPAKERLERILESHFPGREHTAIRGRALAAFLALRQAGMAKKPATSELLQWVDALLHVFERDHVERALADFERQRAKHEDATHTLPWERLPGLSTLVKLREDRDQLGLAEAPA